MRKISTVLLIVVIIVGLYVFFGGNPLPICDCMIPSKKLYGVLENDTVCWVRDCVLPDGLTKDP